MLLSFSRVPASNPRENLRQLRGTGVGSTCVYSCRVQSRNEKEAAGGKEAGEECFRHRVGWIPRRDPLDQRGQIPGKISAPAVCPALGLRQSGPALGSTGMERCRHLRSARWGMMLFPVKLLFGTLTCLALVPGNSYSFVYVGGSGVW